MFKIAIGLVRNPLTAMACLLMPKTSGFLIQSVSEIINTAVFNKLAVTKYYPDSMPIPSEE